MRCKSSLLSFPGIKEWSIISIQSFVNIELNNNSLFLFLVLLSNELTQNLKPYKSASNNF